MAQQLEDGTGSGQRVKVDDTNRLHVHSVGETVTQNASIQGDSYNINTGNISLTSSSKSTCLYFKNVSAEPVHIETVGYLLGNSIGGTGDLLLGVEKGNTGGSIVTSEDAVSIFENKNTTSSNSLNGVKTLAYKGDEGYTCTGGTPLYSTLLSGSAKTYLITSGNIVVESGGVISINITPQASNTKMDIQIFLGLIEYKLT